MAKFFRIKSSPPSAVHAPAVTLQSLHIDAEMARKEDRVTRTSVPPPGPVCIAKDDPVRIKKVATRTRGTAKTPRSARAVIIAAVAALAKDAEDVDIDGACVAPPGRPAPSPRSGVKRRRGGGGAPPGSLRDREDRTVMSISEGVSASGMSADDDVTESFKRQRKEILEQFVDGRRIIEAAKEKHARLQGNLVSTITTYVRLGRADGIKLHYDAHLTQETFDTNPEVGALNALFGVVPIKPTEEDLQFNTSHTIKFCGLAIKVNNNGMHITGSRSEHEMLAAAEYVRRLYEIVVGVPIKLAGVEVQMVNVSFNANETVNRERLYDFLAARKDADADTDTDTHTHMHGAEERTGGVVHDLKFDEDVHAGVCFRFCPTETPDKVTEATSPGMIRKPSTKAAKLAAKNPWMAVFENGKFNIINCNYRNICRSATFIANTIAAVRQLQ